MAIQHRRGIYDRFDPSRLVAGEWAIVLSGDTSASDGRAAYICFAAGTVKRIATYEDMAESIANANEELIEELTAQITAATTAANTAASNANTKATAANTAASSANTAASAANTAASNANSKATAANTAASSANSAASSATTAAGRANTAADAANAAATSATEAAESVSDAAYRAETAATSANTAAGSAYAAAQRANTAADSANAATSEANAATSEANAAIEAMGDISELAVPEMTASVRGGAKVGGSTQVVGGKLEVKLSESATGTSVTTGSTSALRELQVHGRSVQDVTPTPDAPVPVQVVEGRNLVDFAHPAKVNTGDGVTFTINADGSYDIHGTATRNTYIYVTNNSSGFQLPAGRYTLSARNEDGSYPSVLRVGASRWLDGTNTTLGSASGHALTFNHDGHGNLQFLVYVDNGGTIDATVYPQLEAGPTATPYVPYSSIGIVVGDTATSIDLQGNTLASLPDGTRDELHVDSAGRVWIEKRVGYASTDTLSSHVTGAAVLTNFVRIPCNGALADNPAPANTTALNRNGYCNIAPFTGTAYSSDTLHAYAHTTSFYLFAPVGDKSTWNAETAAEWVTEHGAYAYYTPAATTTIDLGYIAPPAIPSGSVVTVSASLTPTFDLDCWTEHASELADITDAITTLAGMVIGDEQESIASSIAPVEDSTASANHAVGDYLMLGARLYRVTTAIASGERITPGTNVTGTTVMAEIVSLLS